MAITVEHDSRTPNSLKLRRALALPIYAVSLILSFVSDGLADLAAAIANDPRP
jgi:hypothetical protein